ncbi:MAG: L-threonylcarbamoyladenylate synthase [Sporomusaceae bacterium]|nr:L-threonylcarbamoyladenylate synthase [Sporomusaceae bacterium]
MATEIVKVDPLQPDPAVIAAAAAIIRHGGLVAFPTETVYGLGANGLDAAATRRIFAAKGRPADNPLILHIADPGDIQRLVERVNSNAAALMQAFWPGPLTVVLKRSAIVPDAVTAGLDSVAIRLPQSTVARALIRAAGVPIAAPSANTSGRPSPTSAQAVAFDLDGRVEMILDGGRCTVGLESTVIDCTTPVPTLLRPGGVTREMLLAILGELDADRNLADQTVVPRSPGMKYTHYAPAAPMTLVAAATPAATAGLLLREVNLALAAGKRVGAVVAAETAAGLPAAVQSAVYGRRGDKQAIAGSVYDCLRRFDQAAVDIIFCEAVDETGIGLAIMNRLRKAAGYRIVSE